MRKDNFPDEGHGVWTGNSFLDQLKQNWPGNRREKFTDVTLQVVQLGVLPVVRFGRLQEFPDAASAVVGAFFHSAGIGVGDEYFLEEGFDGVHERLVDHAVAETGCCYLALFGIVHGEVGVRRGSVSFGGQFPVQSPQFSLHVEVEPGSDRLVPVAEPGAVVGGEEIFELGDLLEHSGCRGLPFQG